MSDQSDCNCNGGTVVITGCNNTVNCLKNTRAATESEKKWSVIRKTNRFSSNQQTLFLAADKSYKGTPKNGFNMGYGYLQMSDSIEAGVIKRHVPRRQTRHRPGGASAGGAEGVDVKHGSYARYLNKLKGKVIKREKNDRGLCNDELCIT